MTSYISQPALNDSTFNPKEEKVMHTQRTPNVLFVLSICVSLVISFLLVPASYAAGRPKTIPALKEWSDGSGAYTFSSTSRIVLDSAYASQLGNTGAAFSDDLRYLSGWAVSVVNGSTANVGDIFLSLNSTDSALGTEGYSLTITDRITINARNDAGAFYGTRTILQLLKQSYTIAAGTARDWPSYPERGLMVDVARKYFTVQWLQSQIKDLAYQKLNYLQLHLSDTQGFRLESSSHPEIVSSQHYSKAEIQSLVQLGQRYHVMIIPEIDMPGHMAWILASHSNLKLSGNSNYLDLSQQGAYDLVNDLLQEYLPLFPAPYWAIGADEYVSGADFNSHTYPQLDTYAQTKYNNSRATGIDTFLGFVNWVNGIVRANGKTMRAWADPWEYRDLPLSGSYVHVVDLDRNIVLAPWNTYQNPQKITDTGYPFVNASWHPLYYGPNYYLGDPKTIYESWTPYKYFDGGTLNSTNTPLLKGSQVSIWCDNPDLQTENQIADGIQPMLRGMAQNAWDSTGVSKIVPTYTDFVNQLINPIGRAPGYGSSSPPPPQATATRTPTSAPPPNGSNLALNKPATASSTYSTYTAGNAVDGSNSATWWWSSAAAPQTIYVDLGRTATVSEVRLLWGTGDYPTGYQIQTKVNSGDAWTTQLTKSGATGGQQNHTFAAVSARYVQINMTASGGNWIQLYNFEVYGSGGGATATPTRTPTRTPTPGTTTNLALNKPATASSIYSTYVAGNAVDGNSNTQWWSSAAAPQTIYVDLGSAFTLSEVRLLWGTGDYPTDYQIQTKVNSGDAWTTRVTKTSATGSQQNHTFAAVSARYVQINMTASGGNWIQLYNFEVYGQ